MRKILDSVSEYIDIFEWEFDNPNDKGIIYTPIYKKFLENGKVGRMTETEARKQDMYWLGGGLDEAVTAVTKAREKLIKLYPTEKEGLEAANRFLPYEAMFRIAY